MALRVVVSMAKVLAVLAVLVVVVAAAGSFPGHRVAFSKTKPAETVAHPWVEADKPEFPNGYVWGCLNVSKGLPFCDNSLRVDLRVADLINRLTLEEKLGLISADTVTSHVNACNCMDSGVKRFGIPPYMHLVETNTAVASSCLGPDRCATEFPSPSGLAASFNRTLWRAKGEVISTEMRALNNAGWYRGMEVGFSKIGLTGFGPNINIVRDPRFGRNSEIPSEDPFLTGSYAVEFVKGCQEGPDPRYLKMVSGLKHYAAYSVEDGREYRIFNVSMFDLWDTYLVQYEMGFDPNQGNAQAVMCSYAGVNGVPSCANSYLLNEVLRGKWGREDVLVATDCGAIGNMAQASHYAKNDVDAAAKTLNGGSDLNLGDQYFSPEAVGGNGALLGALNQSLTDEAQVNTAVRHVITKRFLTGQFDPLDSQVYTKIGPDVVNSTQHWDFVLDAAQQSLVLLKNDQKTLPFSEGRKLAVVGPHIHSTRDLFEDYMGDVLCADGSETCVRTIAEVFTTLHGPQLTQAQQGVDIDSQNRDNIDAALTAVAASDQVVLVLGIGNTQERETLDRTLTTLPGLQTEFAEKVLALNKPTVIVLINGGILSIDTLIPKAPAIIEAFYPAYRGGEALYMSIFGKVNRWGRLPVTVYDSGYVNQVDMYSFDVTHAPGRTYRYYTGKPLFEFGYGLSYTTFSLTCRFPQQHNSATTVADCIVQNTGSLDGDAVVLIYHKVSDSIRGSVDHPVPAKSLAEFTRVSLRAGEKTRVSFTLAWKKKFVLTNNNGDKVLYAGKHYVLATLGMGEDPVVTEVDVTQYQLVEEAPPGFAGNL